MKKLWAMGLALAGVLLVVKAQEHDFSLIISKGERPALAVPDLRGDAQAQGFMGALNSTLWSDLDGGGIFKMVPKTMYPTTIPQQPADFRTPPPVNNTPPARGRKKPPPPPQSGGGLPAGGGAKEAPAAPARGGGFGEGGWVGPPAAGHFPGDGLRGGGPDQSAIHN